MNKLKTTVSRIDQWQRGNRPAAVLFGVLKKFTEDQANQFVVALGWYGFVAIYPLLLVVITVFGYIGAASLGHGIVSTLHQFPVVGSQFNPANANELHGSGFGLVIGLVGLLYGGQGVTQTAQQGMVRVWNLSSLDQPPFLARLARSLIGLSIIGIAFVFNAAVATFATAQGTRYAFRILVIVGMLAVNWVLYGAAFRALTPKTVTTRPLLPGAAVGAVGFTLLITVGSGLIQHQIRHSSATYGQFGVVIGLVGFLFLLAKISLYGAELNPVLARHLWPRAMGSAVPTPADERALEYRLEQDRQRADQRISVRYDDAVTQNGNQIVAARSSVDRPEAP
jgi:uncharacterized BrkB/YihY/UPF0761 family membrane protein